MQRGTTGRLFDMLNSAWVSVALLGLAGVAEADDSVPGGWDASIGFQSFAASSPGGQGAFAFDSLAAGNLGVS